MLMGWHDASNISATDPLHVKSHRMLSFFVELSLEAPPACYMLRLMMGAHDLLTPTCLGATGPRAHDGTIIPEQVDTMWGTDLATTWAGEGEVAVFVAVDRCSAACVGIHAAHRATRFEALEPILQDVRRCFGAFGRTSPAASPCAAITEVNTSTCPTLSRRNCVSWFPADSGGRFTRLGCVLMPGQV
jgi:hypothetical protein